MRRHSLQLAFLAVWLAHQSASVVVSAAAFVGTAPLLAAASRHRMPALYAKAGKGFGKAAAEPPKVQTSSSSSSSSSQPPAAAAANEPFLKSADGAKPTPVQVDESLPPEERTKQILRQQYGLKTLEEQRLSDKQLVDYQAKQKRTAEFKKKMENNKDLDIMNMLPPGVLVIIDRFLKIGLGVTGTLFVLGGIGICIEAFSKVSEKPLAPNIDAFIVNIIEPNFTPGLLVLLAFSVSLGAFAALQLSSEASQYREDR